MIKYENSNKHDNYSNTCYPNSKENSTFYQLKNKKLQDIKNKNNKYLRKLLITPPRIIRKNIPNFINEKIQKELFSYPSFIDKTNNDTSSLDILPYSLINQNKNKMDKKEKILYLKLNKNNIINDTKNIFRKLKKYIDKKKISKINLNNFTNTNFSFEKNNHFILSPLSINNKINLNSTINFDNFNAFKNQNNIKFLKLNKNQSHHNENFKNTNSANDFLNNSKNKEDKNLSYSIKKIKAHFSSNDLLIRKITNYEQNIINNFKKKEINPKIKFYNFDNIMEDFARNVNIIDLSTNKEINLKILRNLDQNFINNKNMTNITKEDKMIDSYINYSTTNNSNKIILPKKKYINLESNQVSKESLNNSNLMIKLLNNSSVIGKKVYHKDIKEDLSFLGTNNKLNWNLINEKEKEKGKKLWKKILKSNKKLFKKIKKEEKNKIENLKAENNYQTFSLPKDLNNTDKKKIINLTPQIKTENNSILNNIIINKRKNEDNNIFKDSINIKLNITYNNFKNNSFINKDFIIKDKKIENNFSEKKPFILNHKTKTHLFSFSKEEKNNNLSKINNIDIKKIDLPIKEKDKNIINENISKNINKEKTNSIEAKKIKIKKIKKLKIKKRRNQRFITYLKKNKKDIEQQSYYSQKEEELSKNEKENSAINILNEDKEKEEENPLSNSSRGNIPLLSPNQLESNNIENEMIKVEEKNEEEKSINDTEKNKNKFSKRYKKREKKKNKEKKNNEINEEEKVIKKKHFSKTKRRRPSITFSIFKKNYNNILIEENKKAKNDQNNENKNNNKIRKYFNEVNLDNLKDINNKKLEILFKMKHDMEYKIRKGEIKTVEKEAYKKLEEKINMISNTDLEDLNISGYIDKLEEYFNSFENNLYLAEQKKKDEERINKFKLDLQDDLYFYYILRKKMEQRFGHAIDLKKVNHINELRDILKK